MGFVAVTSGPFVRSSFHAGEISSKAGLRKSAINENKGS
jgi:lipoate synthase